MAHQSRPRLLRMVPRQPQALLPALVELSVLAAVSHLEVAADLVGVAAASAAPVVGWDQTVVLEAMPRPSRSPVTT